MLYIVPPLGVVGKQSENFANGGALPMAAVAEPMGDAIHQDLPPGWWLQENTGIQFWAQNRGYSDVNGGR